MRNRLTVAAVLIASIAACGGDTHESIRKEQVDLTNQIFDLVEGVSDEDSANAAAKKIEDLGKQMKDLEKKFDELPKQSAEEKKALEDTLQADKDAIMKRMMGVATKAQQYPVLQDALKNIQ